MVVAILATIGAAVGGILLALVLRALARRRHRLAELEQHRKTLSAQAYMRFMLANQTATPARDRAPAPVSRPVGEQSHLRQVG